MNPKTARERQILLYFTDMQNLFLKVDFIEVESKPVDTRG